MFIRDATIGLDMYAAGDRVFVGRRPQGYRCDIGDLEMSSI